MADPPELCPYCASPVALAFRVPDINRRISTQRFSYFQCESCRLLFLHPAPADLGRYYPSTYYTLPSSVEQLAEWAEHERYKIDVINRFRQSGRLLEIGPAGGGFAFLAKRAGFDVSAIEMSPDCCEFLTRVVGVQVMQSNDEAAALRATQPADVIALWHVVEHLHEPFALLNQAAKNLKPGGILVIATPNPAALQFAILRSHWVHVDAPRHLFLFPIPVMRQILKAQGLEPLLTTTRDPGSIGWNEFGWEYSLANLVGGARLKYNARRLGRLVTRVLAPWEQVEGRGSAYTIIFQRPEK